MATHFATAPAVTPSLEDIHSTVPIPRRWWRRFLAFSGPAILISVGYMDPGNWGADLQAGSKYGYTLLWVLVVSNLMALLLQTLATRLGVATGRDLAQACRESYPRRTVVGLWILTEIAIAATDLAEVIGTIIALKLLFGLPYLGGLAVAAGDTFLLLALQRRGVRLLEVLTLALVGVIGVSFAIELVLAHLHLNQPDWLAVARGFVPALAPGDRTGSLYIASAMLGATVMPHNLYLHSALVQTRSFAPTPAGKRLACKYNFLDSLLALNGAFFVNAAILVLAAATFTYEVETLQEAHRLLTPLLGSVFASVLFAVALLASGQSSTLTGTLAGQVVMEGFVQLRVRPWARRLVTRLFAIVPALIVLSVAGRVTDDDRRETVAAVTAGLASQTPLDAAAVALSAPNVWRHQPDDRHLFDLLVLSQAILSFQLPFAIIPLLQLTGDRRRMGDFASGAALKTVSWACALLVVGLNLATLTLQMNRWAAGLAEDNVNPWWVYGTVGPLSVALLGFLIWVTAYPLRRPVPEDKPAPPPRLTPVTYGRIGVAIEFGKHDPAILARAAALVREQPDAELVVLHIVEGVGADYYGVETAGIESQADRSRMEELVEHLRRQGLRVSGALGFGTPAEELIRLVTEQRLDLLVVGTHGHRFLADLALGATVAPVLHRLTIPVLVVPTGA
jgi:manganese transport protein